MKRIICYFGKTLVTLLLCAGFAVTGCYNDSALQETLRDHEERISALETLCAQLNTNVASLQTIIEALDANDYVTGVAPIVEGNKTIGYTLTFFKGGSVTIYIADAAEFKIDNGFWFVSYDGGKTWEKVGETASGGDDIFITDIEVDAHNMTFILSDGETVIKVPLAHLPPVMTVNQGYNSIRFRGKALPTSVDYTVGVYVADSEESLYSKIIDQSGFKAEFFDSDGTFEIGMSSSVNGDEHFGSFEEGTTKYYRTFVRVNGVYAYSDLMTFTIDYNGAEVVSEVEVRTKSYAKISGHVSIERQDNEAVFLRIYETDYEGHRDWETEKEIPLTLDSENNFTVSLSDLKPDVKYLCYICIDFGSEYYTDEYEAEFFIEELGPYDLESDLDVSQANNLSSSGSANCYIISETGLYKFKTVKGNSETSVGDVVSASILWETFGTDTAPQMLDLIGAFCYKDGYVVFQMADTFKEGNAVIAAKDASNNILWSWHIWLVEDAPQGQEYYNNAGTMMDRNLGATSATPGDVGALGLLYQWGRKDPFLGSSSISESVVAASTIIWPSAVSTSSSAGTVSYVTMNPTIFVTGSAYSDNDWSYNCDNSLWTESNKTKSIYDPCPAGWRVPDGGKNGVWSKALGVSSYYEGTYDDTNKGVNFAGKFGDDHVIWYPASGSLYTNNGQLRSVGNNCNYRSVSLSDGRDVYNLYFANNGYINPSYELYRSYGSSVRCLQESK